MVMLVTIIILTTKLVKFVLMNKSLSLKGQNEKEKSKMLLTDVRVAQILNL